MKCTICNVDAVRAPLFVVVLTRYRDTWLFSRHHERMTWETQGGHIEEGETPLVAAHRELYEESGARADMLTPICGYYTEDDSGRRYGVVYLAIATSVDPLPESEIAEVRAFDALPEALTYPHITPHLFEKACGMLAACGTTTTHNEVMDFSH